MGSDARDKPRRIPWVKVGETLAHLKPEDLQLLRWLLRSPFSRAEDLAQARSIRPSTVYRHLTFLQNLGVVERITPATLGTSGCSLYHLSHLGIHVVATQMHRSARALARHCHTDEASLQACLPRVWTLVTLQDLINGIHALSPHKLGMFGYPASVWWACVRDYRHAFSYRERASAVEASGGLVLQVRSHTTGIGQQATDRWYALFILLDNGIESCDLITERLRGLLTFRESPERWRGEQSSYSAFPTLLILATTAHRRDHWRRKAREVAAQMQADPLEGAMTSLEEMERQENRAQFPWLLPWRSLSSNTICHLQDLLEPMPQEAIPAGLLLPHEWQDLDFEDLPSATTPTHLGRSLPTVIEGRFTVRAAHLRTESTPDTSEQIALLSLSLTRRLLDLLTFILDHPMISIDELAALHGMQLASMERSIRALRRLGCLELVDTRRYQQEIRKRAPEALREKLVVKADIGQRWQLSASGMRLLAAAHHFRLHVMAFEEETDQQGQEQGGEPLPTNGDSGASKGLIQRSSAGIFGLRRVEHTIGVYGFFAHLCQAAQREREQGRRHQLLWWETGIFIGRRYRDHDRMHNLRPDALAAYQVGDRIISFWLEWDRNTMDAKDLMEKFASYQYYIRAREWAREQQLLPWLLIVVPDYDQELRIRNLLTHHFGAISGLTLRITTESRIANLGPLAEIWLPVLPVRERRQDEQLGVPRCRFFEVDPMGAL
jgi:predicted transcriptional regulator